MNASTIQTLKKELGRNKAKTSVLGVLCLVAIYYWIPLIAKFIPGGKPDSEPAVATAADGAAADGAAASPVAVTPTTAAVAPTATPVAAGEILDWERVARAIETDEYMTSVAANPLQKSPFAGLDAVGTEEALPNEIGSPNEETELTELEIADDIGLAVTSVIVGSRRSVATINGVSYKLGDIVNVGDQEFQIVTITADAIAVRGEGRELQVPVNKPWTSPSGVAPRFR